MNRHIDMIDKVYGTLSFACSQHRKVAKGENAITEM